VDIHGWRNLLSGNGTKHIDRILGIRTLEGQYIGMLVSILVMSVESSDYWTCFRYSEAILDFSKPCIGEMEDDLKCYLFCCKLMKPLNIGSTVKNARVLTKLPFLPPLPHRRDNKVGKSFTLSETETVITSPDYVLAYNCSFIR